MQRGRPKKAPGTKSWIVPVSLDPSILSEADRYAKSAGISRSRLAAASDGPSRSMTRYCGGKPRAAFASLVLRGRHLEAYGTRTEPSIPDRWAIRAAFLDRVKYTISRHRGQFRHAARARRGVESRE